MIKVWIIFVAWISAAAFIAWLLGLGADGFIAEMLALLVFEHVKKDCKNEK